MTRVLARLLVVCLVGGAAVIGGSALGVSSAVADDAALIRVAHLSPDTPAVDVVVSATDGAPGEAAFPDAEYADVSPYAQLPAGSYTVAVRRAGARQDTPAVLSTTLEVPAGAARTVALSGDFAELGLSVVEDDLSSPPEDQGRVRVLDGTPADGSVDVRLPDGTDLTASGTGDPVTVPSGPSTVRVGADGAPVTEVRIDVPGGSVQTLVLLEGPDGELRLRPVLDAAGATVTPAGGVAAGGAGPVHSVPTLVPLLALVPLVPLAARSFRGSGTRGSRLGPASLAALAGAVAVTVSAPAAVGTAGPPVTVAAPAVTLAPAAADTVAEPVRVRVPAVGIDAPLDGVRTQADGTLVPPEGTAAAGWYADGPRPGDLGPAVLAAHVDWGGGRAAFSRLAELRPGDAVLVERADGTTARFTVTGTARHAKDAFPTEQVYGPTPRAELRLITCGGAFDRASGSYLDNVVVTAVLVT